MITIKTPGKLMLAGEVSVLQHGNRCIVMALDKHVIASIQASPVITLHAPDVDLSQIQARWQSPQLIALTALTSDQQKTFLTVQKALEVVLCYIQEQGIQTINTFSLTIDSEISSIKVSNGSIVKPGLGSSAATTVAVVSAVLAFHDFDIASSQAKDIIFKLSYLAHIQSQGSMGSGFDIAAATYEKTIIFQRADPMWLIKKIQHTSTLTELVSKPWPGLAITPITLPAEYRILVGFVGTSASTSDIVAAIQKFKATNPEKYAELTTAINAVVTALINAINTNNHHEIIELIKQHRMLLQQLSQACDNKLETPELTKLIDIAESFGAGAKFSGAGGGDCGIAVCFDQTRVDNIKQAWSKHHIVLLEV